LSGVAATDVMPEVSEGRPVTARVSSGLPFFVVVGVLVGSGFPG